MTNNRGPGVRFPPPLLFAAGLGITALLRTQWPLPMRGDPDAAVSSTLALTFVVAGVAWIAWGMITFRRARTAIIPNRPASCIVTHGPYRFGRNPMYVGMSLLYWGVVLWLNSWWGALIFPFVIALLLRFVIRNEERHLTAAFGGEYRAYCARVPRWLGVPRA